MYARSPGPVSRTASCCLGPGPVPRAGLGPSFLIRQADIEPGVFGMGAGRDDWAYFYNAQCFAKLRGVDGA
jgi:hypothetical protein